MSWKQFVHRFMNRNGYEIVQFPVKRFFDQNRFDVVFDVGANVGQYGIELRKKYKYQGQIISFEPLASAYQGLCESAKLDDKWVAVNCALGSSAGSAEIHVAGNSVSSSLLPMLEKHQRAAPKSETVATETISVKRLDDVFEDYCSHQNRVFLKIDTQGFEMEVLSGGSESLPHIKAIQVELNLSQLYQNAPLAEQVISKIRELGFEPYWFSPGFRDPETLQLYQMDGYFLRA